MSDYWKESEKAAALPAASRAAATVAAPVLVPSNEKLARQVESAAWWVWAVAALSAFNLFIAAIGGPVRMAVSLFVPEFVYAIGQNTGERVLEIGFLGIAIAGVALFAGLGFAIRRNRPWSFHLTLAAVGLDAFLLWYLAGFVGIVQLLFHALVLYFAAQGLRAARAINQRKRDETRSV